MAAIDAFDASEVIREDSLEKVKKENIFNGTFCRKILRKFLILKDISFKITLFCRNDKYDNIR